MKFYFSFPFSDKIFCDIQHVMNRRNILRGVVQSNLSAPPAALIYHAVLCYTFAVSLSIIHETQIPFTFFQYFLKKVFGTLSVSQSSTAGVKPLSHGLRRDSSPSRGALGRPSRFRGLALRSFWQCWRNVRPLRQKSLLERQRSDRKTNLMPRPPLLGEVASSVSEDDGEVLSPSIFSRGFAPPKSAPITQSELHPIC